jgi:hypothetical protein
MRYRFRTLYQYRDLLKELVSRDLKLKYRRSFLGYLWSILNPLLVMIVMTIVFSAMFKRNIKNFPVYLLCGRMCYDFLQTSTNAAQMQMLGNKTDNTMANLGDNLVQALQPALDLVNQLLDGFNKMSESDQTALIETLGAIALVGPGLTIVGNAITAISKIGQLVGKVGKIKELFSTIGGFLSNPATWGLAAGAGLFLLVDYLDSIPSKLESVAAGAKDIPITVDEGTVSETLSKIAEVQAALDQTSPRERACIRALYYDGKKMRQYARETGCSHQFISKTAKNTLRRMRGLLKERNVV